MPIYKFKCPMCGREAEKMMKADEPAPFCYGCTDDNGFRIRLEKQLTAPGFRLHGQGSYGRGRV